MLFLGTDLTLFFSSVRRLHPYVWMLSLLHPFSQASRCYIPILLAAPTVTRSTVSPLIKWFPLSSKVPWHPLGYIYSLLLERRENKHRPSTLTTVNKTHILFCWLTRTLPGFLDEFFSLGRNA